jgi:ABC-2 type transport system permease protein
MAELSPASPAPPTSPASPAPPASPALFPAPSRPSAPMAPARPAAPPLPGTGPLLGAQIRYQLLLMMRNPRAVMGSLVIPVLLLVLSSSRHANLSPRVEDALVAGLATFGLVVTAYVSHAIGLVTSRQDGVLRRWRATPLPTWCFFGGKIAATSLIALASVAIAVGAGLSLYHVHLTAGAALSLLVIFLLGALAWAAIGTAITPLVPTAQTAGPVLMLTYLPVILFSGGLGSLNAEPGWLATVARYLPAQPIIDAATRALQQPGGTASIPGHDLAVLAAWAVAGVVVSVCFFRWDPVRPRHAR